MKAYIAKTSKPGKGLEFLAAGFIGWYVILCFIGIPLLAVYSLVQNFLL
jgi:hypothetical protein